ncbi:hypothetical protein H9660_10085 [Clostridium sp. Sa3CUN1]|uniref:Uncharacterized protein n=1 Tax=Clostridium gallinarum TaxID=2762246 RepID=A0ABR8Q4Z9_9CLOT|nr:hypothetical protein [Clostridium gallinarum]MBD7915496.1 hypothetical protein [Clostridium gallinarum]
MSQESQSTENTVKTEVPQVSENIQIQVTTEKTEAEEMLGNSAKPEVEVKQDSSETNDDKITSENNTDKNESSQTESDMSNKQNSIAGIISIIIGIVAALSISIVMLLKRRKRK